MGCFVAMYSLRLTVGKKHTCHPKGSEKQRHRKGFLPTPYPPNRYYRPTPEKRHLCARGHSPAQEIKAAVAIGTSEPLLAKALLRMCERASLQASTAQALNTGDTLQRGAAGKGGIYAPAGRRRAEEGTTKRTQLKAPRTTDGPGP